MPLIRIDRFGGFAPKLDWRRLPPKLARECVNARLDSADLRPFNLSQPYEVLSSVEAGTLWPYEDGGANPFFLAFGRDLDVSVVRSPVRADVHKRVYWCVHGDGIYAISDPRSPTPAGYASPVGTPLEYRRFRGYRVGTPRPDADLTAAEEGIFAQVGSGSPNAIESISEENPVKITLADPDGDGPKQAKSPFKDGDRVQITLADGLSDNSPFAELEGKIYTVRNVLGGQFELFGMNGANSAWPPDDIPLVTLTRVIEDADLVSRAYVFTYVNIYGEEGPPSDPSNFVDIEEDGGVAVVGITAVPPAASDGGEPALIDRIRVYRTISGNSGTRYVLVGTLPINGSGSPDAEGLTWETAPPSTAVDVSGLLGAIRDAVPAVELGEDLPTESWYPPPAECHGLEMMPQGYAVTFKGSTLYLSELNLPHAWPPEYQLTVDDFIVGIKACGDFLVVGTRSVTYVMTGVDPAAASLRRVDIQSPLLHPLAMVDAGGFCLFPSTDGLFAVRPGQSRLVSRMYDKESWLQIAKTRTRAVWHDSRYIMFAAGAPPYFFQFDGTDEQIQVSYINQGISAACVSRDFLYVTHAPDYDTVSVFGGQPNPRTVVWRSGLFLLPKPSCLAVGQVIADKYPVTLRLLAPDPATFSQDNAESAQDQYSMDEFTFTSHEVTVRGAEPFRLPADYMSREWVIEIQTIHRVIDVQLASSMDELKQR